MSYTKESIEAIGCEIATKDATKILSQRQFSAMYGRTPDEAYELWEMCGPDILPKTYPKHLFWALMFMKLYLTFDAMGILLDTSLPTLQKWIWKWIEAIASRHVDIIHWSRRFRNAPKDVWCYVTVDGTDFSIGEPVPFDRRWKSHKSKGASVKYEVAISIYSGDIVWIYGPHIGSKHDLSVFRESLVKMLDEGEMVEADAGYGAVGKAVGTDGLIRSRDDYMSEEERREKSEARARLETCNRRFKQWGILKQQFRNQKKLHQYVFYAIAVMTQMSIDNGNVLFQIAPRHLKKSDEPYYI